MSTLFHNPRCSKSRQTLALLEDKGIEFKIVEYLNNPPSVNELSEVLKMLNMKPLDLMRTKEAIFKELNLSKSDLRSDDAWVELMVKNPKLIERPVFVHQGKAAVGRPPENVLKII